MLRRSEKQISAGMDDIWIKISREDSPCCHVYGGGDIIGLIGSDRMTLMLDEEEGKRLLYMYPDARGTKITLRSKNSWGMAVSGEMSKKLKQYAGHRYSSLGKVGSLKGLPLTAFYVNLDDIEEYQEKVAEDQGELLEIVKENNALLLDIYEFLGNLGRSEK